MRQLRPYQQDLLSRVQHALADHPKGRLMLQLPTGGGKTVIGGALLAHWLIDNRKALWLTHRKELVERTRGMLTDPPFGKDSAGHWERPPLPAGASFYGSDRGSADRLGYNLARSSYPGGGPFSVFEGLAGGSRDDWLGNA